MSIISMTVDHDLQACSKSMAEIASKNASLLGVRHLTLKIPWNQPPFQNSVENARRLELKARNARYRILFDAMTEAKASQIVFGHHADDQVETALMRLQKGSTLFGAAGMASCRRWGMGDGKIGDLSFYGHHGLDRFILRPLLPFSKVSRNEVCAMREADILPGSHLRDMHSAQTYIRNGPHQFPASSDSTQFLPIASLKDAKPSRRRF